MHSAALFLNTYDCTSIQIACEMNCHSPLLYHCVSGVVPLLEALQAGVQIAQGLEQLHAAGVLVLDLKPGG